MEIIENGSVTSVPGFRATGVHCGLKKTDARDLALITSDRPCNAAAVFTLNQVAAAPVQHDRQLLKAYNTVAQALLINSGCANACTGARGLADAQESARYTAERLGLKPEAVWVMSTGVIGQPLQMDKLRAGIILAVADVRADGGHEAAQAIMTTDTRPKEYAVRMSLNGRPVTIAGMCKGAGMIHPNMATMLAVIATDAQIAPRLLQMALANAADRSFNMMTIDGDTSTNDTLLLLANGLAGNEEVHEEGPAFAAFELALTEVATTLAKMIAADGEGASKFVEVVVQGARTEGDAKTVALAIAHSPLVKTALYGRDANWGRVICAVGYSGVIVDPDRISMWFGDLHLVKNGQGHDVDEERALQILSEKQVRVTVDLGLGDASATVFTCDLTHDYISINAHYRT